jgi:hypothetical protein
LDEWVRYHLPVFELRKIGLGCCERSIIRIMTAGRAYILMIKMPDIL